MTINSIKNQDPQINEKAPVTVQNGLQKEMLKESMNGANSMPRQMMQLITSTQPMNQLQDTAQKQIQKGFLDIKV